MKLQEGYASENKAVGTWSAIGYKDPGAGNNHLTTSFDYSAKAEATDGMWQAKARVALNECQKDDVWELKTSYSSSTGSHSMQA